jgi:predicted phage baseplate assembly protein
LVNTHPAAPHITRVRNPLPARGGVDAEAMEEVRQRAPAAFRVQERAVTTDDYAEVIERDPGIQSAAATLRWTGSWHTFFLTADRTRGRRMDPAFRAALRNRLETYRLAGHDLDCEVPRLVSLEILMHVCVQPGYFRSDVRTALGGVFSNGQLADGRLGVFHPDNFTFGQPVFLSRLYAAAQAVAGVASVHIEKFQRQGQPDPTPLQTGRLELGRLEIARCDNDRNFPENGVFQIEIGGGK